MTVLSGSMAPTYPVGSMVFTRPVQPEGVKAGDVITFRWPSDPSELVTHRVVAVDTSTGSPVFTTKGDANDAADLDPVPAANVQGRLWFGVPQLGRIAAVLHSPQGLGFLVLLVCAVVAVSPGKRPDPAEPSTDDEAREKAPSRLPDAGDVETTTVLPTVDRAAVPRAMSPRPPVPPRSPASRPPAAPRSSLPLPPVPVPASRPRTSRPLVPVPPARHPVNRSSAVRAD
jgi:signal peptidase